MANVESAIAKIDQQLRSLYQEQSLAAKIGKTNFAVDPILQEYIKLTATEGIILAIQYIALDGLSQHFHLYPDESERSCILAAMADELNQSPDSEILASIQIIQYTYPLIYELSKKQINLTQERAISKITGLNIPISQPVATIKNHISAPKHQISSSTTPPHSSPKKLIIAITISSLIAAAVGALISNSSHKISTDRAISDNASIPNRLTTISTADRNHNLVDSSPSISTANQNNRSTEPPPEAVAATPIPNANSSSNISRDAAVKVIQKWLDYKRILLAPPYDTTLASEILTGNAYRNNIDNSSAFCNDVNGCLSSVDWLKKYQGEYSFSVQKIDSIDRFEASGDRASIFVTITEYRTLHQPGKSTPSGGTNKVRYDLTYENGKVKINDYHFDSTPIRSSNSSNISKKATIRRPEFTVNNIPDATSESSTTANYHNPSFSKNSSTESLQTSPSRPSPAQAIREHYQALKNRDYDLTWDNLSSNFKAESGKSSTLARQEYEDWWKSVVDIDLHYAETSRISNDGNEAIVKHHLSYTMKDGRVVRDKNKRIFLVWNEDKQKWLIDRRK